MEKTFEELIESKLTVYFTPEHYEEVLYFKGKTIIELMKQVREATKKECQDVVKLNYNNGFHAIFDEIEELPTDRIKN